MDKRLNPLLKYFTEDEVMVYFWARTDDQIQYLRNLLDSMDEERLGRFKAGLRYAQQMREAEAYAWTLRN